MSSPMEGTQSWVFILFYILNDLLRALGGANKILGHRFQLPSGQLDFTGEFKFPSRWMSLLSLVPQGMPENAKCVVFFFFAFICIFSKGEIFLHLNATSVQIFPPK